jgi:Leucine-rich repeat (LRR) protein
MRINTNHLSINFLTILLMLVFALPLLAQEEEESNIAAYQEEVRQMVSFLQYSMNVLGDPVYSAKEKDVVINESFSKIFVDDKVQIEDDLVRKRDVVTNKDVQAYLKDVDFFFKQVTFEFNIIDIDHSETPEGNLFFTVKMMRSLKGITVENDSMNSDQERYIEVNVDEENKDLKIASIYTTKLSRDEELAFWWAGLSMEWRTILGVDIIVKEGLRLSDVSMFSDSTYVVGTEQFSDSIKIIDFVKQAADKQSLDLSGAYMIQNLKPLVQLKTLNKLDISGSAIKDIFPIRNITTLTFLDCSRTMIEDLGPLRYSKSLRELRIGNTPIHSITVIENFDNLEVLDLSQTVIDSLPSIDQLVHLKELNCSSTNIVKLDSIRYLTSLEILDCSNTAIEELKPISRLPKLKKLDISKTKIASLELLASMSTLETLVIEDTEIARLTGLEELKNLQVVYADDAKIEIEEFVKFANKNFDTEIIFMTGVLENYWKNLDENWKQYFSEKLQMGDSLNGRDLHKILKLKNIDVSGKSAFVDLSPLKYTPLVESLDFSGTPVSSLGPVLSLKQLKRIDGSYSQVIDVAALGSIPGLKVINFENTGVASIAALSGIQDLDTLIFNKTSIKDLSALNGLTFKIAYFDNSRVADEDVLFLDFEESKSVLVYKSQKLQTWWGNMDDKWQDAFVDQYKIAKSPETEDLHRLVAIRSLEVSSTGLRNLDPIPEFIRLESLTFTETRISSLQPLAALKRLKTLKCPRNPISEIQPLASITTLELLDLNNTQVDNLKEISALSALKELTFSGTNVKDLSPIADLKNLEVLDFSKTKVRQIKALDELSNLKTVNCYNNKLSDKKVEEFRMNNPDCDVVFY